MKALFIGYSKCGTKTMNAVFQTLGYSCYDMPENFILLEEKWKKIFEQGATVEDFKSMYANVDSCVDFPAYIFWEEILQAFPETKLLVMYRDEESWIKSFINQCNETNKNLKWKIIWLLSPTCRRLQKVVRLFVYHVWGGSKGAWLWQTFTGINYTLMRHRYRQHNLYIQQKAPKNQLHVVDFKRGWDPICKFLGEPVPDVPFPHQNKGGKIAEEYIKGHPLAAALIREGKITLAILSVILTVGSSYFFRNFLPWNKLGQLLLGLF